MTSAIEAINLSVKRGHQAALKHLTFSIPAGTLSGLIGPSGSGKTTFMRSVIGAQIITDGQLKVLDEAAGAVSLRRRIGYVTQTPAIYNDLTVGQNLRYFGSIIHASARSIEETIRTVELEQFRHRQASQLSGGQRARVSLGIALLGSPDLLVFDEPTVGLDPLLRDRLWKLFKKLAHEQGKTLLVSSHVMDEAARCDHLLLLREGELIATATPSQLKEHTKTNDLDAAFIAIIKEFEARERK